MKELYDGASDESVALVFDYCSARKLDPLKKPVHIVPVWSNRRGKMVDAIMPGISEVRTTAMRTGKFAGMDETKFGTTITQDVGDMKGFQYPEWAQTTVYRMIENNRCSFPGPRVYFLEAYATKGRDTYTPNAMWAKRPWGQLEKCAEAAALRRAFPEEIGLTAEEMAGRASDEELPNVTGSAEVAETKTDPATGAETTTVKRPPVPRKSKGAAALGAIDVTVAPATTETAAGGNVSQEKPAAGETSAPVSSGGTGKPVDEKPAEPAKTEATEKPAEPAKTEAPPPAQEEPAARPTTPPPQREVKPAAAPTFVLTARVTETKTFPVKNNPKFDKTVGAKLAGSIEINGAKQDASTWGWVYFDPERAELRNFEKAGDEEIEFTIEERTPPSNPEKRMKVIIKAEVADVAM
jgi:phage recombination protein Bet